MRRPISYFLGVSLLSGLRSSLILTSLWDDLWVGRTIASHFVIVQVHSHCSFRHISRPRPYSTSSSSPYLLRVVLVPGLYSLLPPSAALSAFVIDWTRKSDSDSVV